MATTFNAFDLLVGKGEQVKASAKKKNKKSKSKQEEAVSKGVTEPAVNGHEIKTGSSAPGQNLVVSSDEMIAILEKAARSSTSGSERVRLWKEWCRQASDKSDKAVQYRSPDGSYVDFTQLFIRSKALEITAESCLTNPVSQQQQAYLLQLFSTFLPSDAGKSGNILVGALTRLAELLANDAPDTVGAAQRAIQHVVKQLKSARADHSSEAEAGQVGQWLHRLQALDKDMATEQTLMQKLAQASANAVTRERIQSARKVLKLQEQKMELLRPGNVPNSGTGNSQSSPSAVALKELQSVMYNHLKDAEMQEDSVRGKAAYADKQKKQARTASDREDAILAKQGSEIAAQVRTLEAQLQTLRMQASEIEQKRSRLQLLRKDAAAASGNGAAQHQHQGLSSSEYQQQLATVDTLLDLLDPHRHSAAAMEQVWAAQATQPDAAADFVSLAHHYLTMNLSFLTEMPQKVSFSKQRIAQAEKLIKLTAGNVKGLETNKKQKEDAEKLLADTMKSAEDALVQSEEVYKSVMSRHHLLAQQDLALASSLAQQVAAVEELYQRISGQYTNVMISFDQVPAPVVHHKAPAPRKQQQPPAAAAAAAAPAPIPTPIVTAVPVEKPRLNPPQTNGTAVASPPRHWAKVQASQPEADGDASLPTPAEAFRSSADNLDGFRTVGSSRRNKKA